MSTFGNWSRLASVLSLGVVAAALGAGPAAAGAASARPAASTPGIISLTACTGHSTSANQAGPARLVAVDPAGMATDGHNNNLAIADPYNARVRVIASTLGLFYGQPMNPGNIYWVAGDGTSGFTGDGGPGTAAELASPEDVAVDGHDNLLIADSGNNRVRVVANVSGTFYGVPMTAGDIYTLAGNGTAASSGDGGPATSAALNDPEGVAVDHHGNVLISEFLGNRVRVVAATSGTFYGQKMTAGDIYTIAGSGGQGYGGDGGPATAAKLYWPTGLAVDASGNVLIADTYNLRVRVVAAKSGTFYGKAMTAGNIYTVAGNGRVGGGSEGDGGPARQAELAYPTYLTVDGHGNVLIADSRDERVRTVAESSGSFYGVTMNPGDIYTVAGNGIQGFSGDKGPAITAELSNPTGVAVSRAGDLVIADTGNCRVRTVTP